MRRYAQHDRDNPTQRCREAGREAQQIDAKRVAQILREAVFRVGFEFGVGDGDGFLQGDALLGVAGRVYRADLAVKLRFDVVQAVQDAPPVAAAVVHDGVHVLLGDRSDLPQGVADDLFFEFVAHLVAVEGVRRALDGQILLNEGAPARPEIAEDAVQFGFGGLQVFVQRRSLPFEFLAQTFGQRGITGDERDLLVERFDIFADEAVHKIKLGVQLLLGGRHALEDGAQVLAHGVHPAGIAGNGCEQAVHAAALLKRLLGRYHENLRAQVEQFL